MLSFFPSIAMVSSYSSSTLKEPRICDPSAAAARVSGTEAVAACAAMAFFYVAILYAPTLILRLPPPTSLDSFMIRRFACAAVSSAASVLACVLLLGVSRLPCIGRYIPIRQLTGTRIARYREVPLKSIAGDQLREKEEEGEEEEGETCFAVHCSSLVPPRDPSPAGDCSPASVSFSLRGKKE
ncbi:hypothetical protein BHE74_00057973 [Ensete ventricosum]|nr:hypothetical protein BHE74_00057973 [Ensete ventricosum]